MANKSDGEAIRATRERGLAAFNAGNVDQFLATWAADDIIVMMPGAPPIVGKDALRTFLEQALAGASIQETLTAEEQVILGDWAFERLTLAETVTAPGANRVQLEGKAIDIYRRQSDGSWKVARSILNYNAQPAAESAA
jgi:uncharacterized protein (TIGR02246 family)